VSDDDDALEISANDAKGATIALAEALSAAEGQLRRTRAALSRLEDGQARGTDAELLLGADSGGARHFLDGEAVHAGDILLLLTVDGWLGVRYEWSFDPESEPVAYASLPGAFAGTQVAFRIPEGARLARRSRQSTD